MRCRQCALYLYPFIYTRTRRCQTSTHRRESPHRRRQAGCGDSGCASVWSHVHPMILDIPSPLNLWCVHVCVRRVGDICGVLR